jgi:hypothetical protein
MATTTKAQLEGLAVMIDQELRWAGLLPSDGSRVYLQYGNSQGNSYRLYTTHPDSTGLSDRVLHLGDGYLGKTRTEAYTALRFILRTLEAVSYSAHGWRNVNPKG